MEQSLSCEELTIRHQFDRLCVMALKGERIDYLRHMRYRQMHELPWSDLAKSDWSKIFTMDEYNAENVKFEVFGHEIIVKDDQIAEALQALSEKKRNVILLSYFMDMSDAEIAKEMHLVRSTIHEHRKKSLELLKKIMEGTDEKRK